MLRIQFKQNKKRKEEENNNIMEKYYKKTLLLILLFVRMLLITFFCFFFSLFFLPLLIYILEYTYTHISISKRTKTNKKLNNLNFVSALVHLIEKKEKNLKRKYQTEFKKVIFRVI
jgi:hypothetical protein